MSEQRDNALALANRVKHGQMQIRDEIALGRSAADRLYDDRADGMPVDDIIMSIPGWGRARTNFLLDACGIAELTRVRELDHQQFNLLEAFLRKHVS